METLLSVNKTGWKPQGLPQFTDNGVLPEGIHDCTLDDLAGMLLFNPHRRAQWLQLMGFLAWPVLNRKFSYAFIGGGFVSGKAKPNDIDVVLETTAPYGPEAFATVSRFFAAGLDQIEEIYAVHLQFWMKGAPPGLSDFRSFFQYDRPDSTRTKLSQARGIVRLRLTGKEPIADLRRHIRGASESEALSQRSGHGLGGIPNHAGNLSGAKRHLATISQYSSVSVMLLDRNGCVEWANERFLACSGFGLDEIVGQQPGAFLLGPKPDLPTLDKLTLAMRDGQDCDCILVNYRKDGRPYLAEVALRPIYDGDRLDGFYSLQENLGAVPPANTAHNQHAA